MTNTVAFRSAIQTALFASVLLPELKNGHWGESTPANHSEDWAGAQVVEDSKRFGVNFEPVRQRYDLLNKEFVDLTLERAQKVAKKAGFEGELDKTAYRRELRDMMMIMRTKRGEPLAESNQGLLGGHIGRPTLEQIEAARAGKPVPPRKSEVAAKSAKKPAKKAAAKKGARKAPAKKAA